MNQASKPRIAITLGDPAGIGPEIVARAVSHPRVLAVCNPLVVGDPVAFALHKEDLPEVEMLPVPGLNKKLVLGRPSPEAGRSAIESLKQGLALLQTRQAEALVTAPISKESLAQSGFGFPGHTEWLAKECDAENVAMLMVAGRLRAVLLTRHIPIAQVSRRLTRQVIKTQALLAYGFVKNILKKRHPRLAICGLNPHAGDGGLIGREEESVFRPAIEALKDNHTPIRGPFGADSVFRDMAQGDYDLVLAPYHDQGMVPLKLYAPDRLVNITLGLPFIRTSPGHGTAYDIAGKKSANPASIIEAICLAAQYSKSLTPGIVSTPS